MTLVQAIIFDFDGTILDTEMPEYRSWEAIYHEFSLTLPHERWLGTIGLASGTADWHPMDHLEAHAGPVDRDTIKRRQREAFHAFVEGEPVRPGVAATLEAAHAAGLRVGLASSATRDWIDWNLARLQLAHLFECVFTREDVAHAKPHPELYLKTCAALDAQPHRSVAIEDSVNGIRAAKAAGLFCVATPNPLTQHLDLSEADLIVETLAALPLDDLLTQARRAHGVAWRT